MAEKKIWSLLVHLSDNMHTFRSDTVLWNDEVWDYILEESVKTGINMIVLDVGDAIQWATHPEITVKNGAWTRKRVHTEVKRLRELGIALIPKLNFATPHDKWLGEYSQMISTNTYYRVCDDLIKEVYRMFEGPEFIHLGFDEEDAKHVKSAQLAIYRQKDQFWHDLRFLIDSVAETGAKPWIWSCPLFNHPDEFKKHIDPDEIVLSPWYYNAFRKEHWTPVESRAEYVAYYNEGDYAKMGIKFVEEDPFLVRFREVALPLMKEGYNYVPCASVFNRCDWNTHDLLEYFKENAPDEQVLGFMAAPWFRTFPENKMYFEETFKFLKEAKEKFYKNK
ncbi:MAG: hypothetical protein IIV81_03360 [Clostridia bacterium]|nr:hypothetical protein [Clostridia bacterium]